MLNSEEYILIIPARGGSKRILNKNLKFLDKKPLIEYSIEYALKYLPKERIWINSDSEKILDIGQKYGIQLFKRIDELARDETKTVEVLKDHISKIKIGYKYLILLQPTSPIRPIDLIKKASKILESNKFKSLFTVSLLEKKIGTIRNNKFLPTNYNLGQRSQDLKKSYYENGLLYISSKHLIQRNILINQDSFPLVTGGLESIIDIDYNEDFELAELIIKHGNSRQKDW